MLQHCNQQQQQQHRFWFKLRGMQAKPRPGWPATWPISRWPTANRKCSTASTSASLSVYCRCRSQAAVAAAVAVAVAAWSVQLRQVLLISEIKWRTPNHGQKRSKTHIKLRHNAPASRSPLQPLAVGATRAECVPCNRSVINIQVQERVGGSGREGTVCQASALNFQGNQTNRTWFN